MNHVGASWGRWPQCRHHIVRLHDRSSPLPTVGPMLPYGHGRSYGDVCLNDGGTLLDTRGLDRFISFDAAAGVIECESGVLLKEIIDRVLPHGWFPAVTPGTAYVTLGGAIANDVHGKNHHSSGTFGNHVLELELQRSDGSVIRCTPTENCDWFAATVGGLGLTGLIRTAKLQLKQVPGAWIQGDSRRFFNLDEFFALAATGDRQHEYSVAWIDCAATGKRLGRGVFMQGDHASGASVPEDDAALRIPFTPPVSIANSLSVKATNELYFQRAAAQQSGAHWHYTRFFYPLDRIRDWNRLYGPNGFFQYQCVLPPEHARDALQEMLARIANSAMGSFLVVLKNFGRIRSLGMLSFARPGTTLALDFPNRGTKTLALLDSLDDITRAARGAVYPAKDARMSGAAFREYFPAWQEFEKYIDPQFSSSFWRRIRTT